MFTAPDADSWVLKGAGALLARLGQARHSKDIDVYFTEQSAAVLDATAALRAAVNGVCALARRKYQRRLETTLANG